MVALEKKIGGSEADTEAAVCAECQGAGTFRHWSDVAYFEDRRVCANCDAGRAVELRIADILRSAQLEQRLFRR